MHDVYSKLREKAANDLRDFSQKNDFTPSDWTTVKTILSAMCKMDSLESSYEDGDSYRTLRMPSISYARERNSRTGRYMSHDYGMSGHSITDRMIDLIERMYDSARSDHERHELDKWIDRIRNDD